MSPRRLVVPFLAAVLFAGSAFIEHRYLAPQRAELGSVQSQLDRLEADLRHASHRLEATRRQQHDLDAQQTAQRAALAAAEAQSRLKLWSGRIALLKRLLAEMPGETIPELRLLTPVDWVQLVRPRELDSPENIRTALAAARAKARTRMAACLQEALRRFAATSQDHLPADIRQLAAYLTPPADLEMLQRYALLRSGKIGDTDEYLIRELPTTDLILSVGVKNWGMKNNNDWRPVHSEEASATLARASAAVQEAIGNLHPVPDVLVAAFTNVSAFKEMAEELEPRMEAILGEDFGTSLKAAVRRYRTEHGTVPQSMADLLPYLPKVAELATVARPMVAQLDYMRDHHGQRPTNPTQLRRYLEKPLDQVQLLRELKLTVEGDSVSMSYNISTDASITVSP